LATIGKYAPREAQFQPPGRLGPALIRTSDPSPDQDRLARPGTYSSYTAIAQSL